MNGQPAGPRSPDSVAAFALRIAVPCLERIQIPLQSLDEGESPDVETVHQLRVASRRAAVAVDLFSDAISLAEVQWWETTLRSVRHAADALRDHDVLFERLETSMEPKWFERLRAVRIDARRSAASELLSKARPLQDQGALAERIASLNAELQVGSASALDLFRATSWALERLKPFWKRFHKAGRRNLRRGSRLHQLRIQAKKLRYAIDLLAEALPDDEAAFALQRLAEVQERLGQINDHRAAARQLKHWSSETEDRETRAKLQAQANFERKAFRNLRSTVSRWLPHAQKRLHRCRRRMMR